jgi:hypothetical protein
MAVPSSELGKRRQAESLVSTLRAGEKMVLKSSLEQEGRITRPILIHDRDGEIKVGNANVVICEAKYDRES